MTKKLFVVCVLLTVAMVLVSGFAFAKKSVIRKSELLKPIDFAPEGYVSQYLLKPAGGYVPSLAPTADAVVGTTWYDQMHNAAMPKMIANDYQPGGQHFTWMEWPSAPPANRYVYYRYNNTLGNFAAKDTVDGGGWNAGYTGLDIFNENYELGHSYAAVIFHTTARESPDPYGTVRRAKVALDTALIPGDGDFSLYDIPEATETMLEAGMWPHAGIDTCGNIHVIVLEGLTEAGISPMGYIRCTPSGDLLKCEGPGVGPYHITAGLRFMPDSNMISYLDHTGAISYIVVADPNSKKVALVWTKWTENWPVHDDSSNFQIAQDVFYLESENCGDDWISADSFGDFTFTNITEWEPDDSFRTYADIAGIYDLEHNLHIFWNAQYMKESTDEYDPWNVALMHWSPRVCPNGDTVKYNVVTSVKNDPYAIYFWAWNRTLSKVSAGVGVDGSAKQGWLFLVWQQLNEGDMSANGWNNGELYFSFSTSLGASWSAPRNLTNTPDTGCTAGNCDSEGWPSLADRVDDYMHIQYILDRDAGASIASPQEGVFTQNYVMYKKEKVDTLTASAIPRIDWSPKGDLVKPWAFVENGGTKTCTLWIANIGTGILTGNLSTGASWITSITPSSFNIGEGPCPEIIEVEIGAYVYVDTFLQDSIHVTSNDQAGNDSFYVRVNVVVSDSYFVPEFVLVDNGTYQLYVSNVGNIGHMKEDGGFYLKDDQFNAILDGSFLVGTDHPTYGKRVGRWIYEDEFMLAESKMEVDTLNQLNTIRVSLATQPLNPLPPEWFWWYITWYEEWWLIFYSGESYDLTDHERWILINHYHIYWNPPPPWWEPEPPGTNPEVYLGMAVDFELPSDIGDVLNIPGYDEDLNLLYQQGIGSTVTPTGARFEDLFAGIAFIPGIWEVWPLSQPYSGHVLPNDVYVYPQQGYRDDSLYTIMSDSGFSVRDPIGPPGRQTDYNCVMTSAHIPAGYLDTAEVMGTFAIGVSTQGLGILKQRVVKMIQCGNANRDDAVDLSDVVHIAKYKMGMLPEPWLYMSDVNGDCKVDLGDVIHLAKNKFGYPGFELECDCGE